MLYIQDFIKKHNNWEELLTNEPYSLLIKRKGNLVLFNYTQGVSDVYDNIVQETRGLVLENSTWNVVRYGFNRFYNLGQGPEADINWASACGLEKLDGSLIFVYYYNGWRVGTRGNIDAEDAKVLVGLYKSYRELFNKALENYSSFNWDRLNPQWTYCFELCSPFNRQVVKYKDFSLTLLMIRDNKTLQEVTTYDTLSEYANFIGVDAPKLYRCSNKEEYQELICTFNEDHEGLVIVDKYNNRVKLKTEQYFYLHYMVNGRNFSPKKIYKIIRQHEEDELLTYFPEYTNAFNEVKRKYSAALALIEDIYIEVERFKRENPNLTRADFVKFAQAHFYPFSLLMDAYNNSLWNWIVEADDMQVAYRFPFILKE